MKELLSKAFSLLSRQQKGDGAMVVGLLVLHSLLDFFGLAFFLPIIVILAAPDIARVNPTMLGIRVYFNFLSVTQFNVVLTCAVFLFILAKTWINHIIIRTKASYAYGVGNMLASRIIDAYLSRSYEKFSQSDFSREVNRMASAPLSFSNNILLPLGTLISESLVFLLVIGSIALLDSKVFLFVAVMLAPLLIVYSGRKNRVLRISKTLASAYPRLLKRGLELAEGLIEIRSSQKESFFKDRFMGARTELDNVLIEDHTLSTGTSRATELIAATCICGLILFALIMHPGSQPMLILLGVYAAASLRIIPSVNRILTSIHQVRINGHIVEELYKFAGHVTKIDGSCIPFVFRNKIILDRVSFQYSDQSKLLNEIALEICKGEKIALTGKSGCGKTTLLLLLLRYLHETSGRVLVDNIVLNHVTGEAWRNKISYVPQRSYILDGTLTSNIAFGESHPDAALVNSLIEDLGLKSWVSSLPAGAETRLGERGVRISGGQLQRISIARALYRRPEILLFDEVTNQLDESTESDIFKTVQKIARDRTIIMITHNRQLLSQFDRVFELKDGRLKETSVNVTAAK
jgi:ABC-type multidrug transport system fused ATPase/permease subunit